MPTQILKLSFRRFFLALGFFMLTACGSQAEKPAQDPLQSGQGPLPLSATMQSMQATLQRILPDLVDRHAFSAKENEARLQKEIGNLNNIAKTVSHADFKAKTDPSYGFLSEGFRDEIEASLEAFKQGKKEYARYNLMNVTSYCIECHTRTSSGPAFQNPNLTQTLKRLPPLERGEYLLSVRQFDAALEDFIRVLTLTDSQKFDFYEYDRALRFALDTTVKFQRDPVKTEKLINQILASPKVPFFLKQTAASWQSSVRDWKQERPSKNPTLNQRIAKAESLIQRGRRAQQGTADRSGDIDLLRGLSELHQILWQKLSKEQLGKVLFLTGAAYQSVRDAALWNIHENYFETCIRRVPHSTWARTCYKALEESIFMGYTGTGGTSIPYDVQVRLVELEKLANPEAPATPQKSK